MSALMKMLGVDKMLEGVDFKDLTTQFESKMKDDREVLVLIKKLASDIDAIKAHLGIDGAYMITDVTVKGE